MAEIVFRRQIVRKQLFTRGTNHKGTDAMSFKLSSQSFRDGDYLSEAHILSKDFGFGCAGGNQSPHLTWSGAPSGTKSFAVTCYDPDAPTGSGFWHWLVVNIPVTATELPLDAGRLASAQRELFRRGRTLESRVTAVRVHRRTIIRTVTSLRYLRFRKRRFRSPRIRRLR